ncbi:MAG: aminotransferase class V-fold PLP-dependent enzyme [Myxococcota bacterium]
MMYAPSELDRFGPRHPRHLFDIPEHVAYLNCAYLAPELTRVAEASRWGLAKKSRPWTITPDDFFEPCERLRELAGRIFGCAADNIALVPAVSYGIETAAQNTPCDASSTVVVLEEQFPSNVYPWRELCKRAGAELITVSRSLAPITDAVVKSIDERTVAVSLPAVHWLDGQALDLTRVANAARAVDAFLVLDLTQSLGVMPFSVEEVDPDFAVAAGYKWLLGPYGVGYLYVAPRNQDKKPLENGWINREKSHEFSQLADYQTSYATGARRFDSGERSNFVTMPMAEAALEQILAWRVESIYERISAVNEHLALEVSRLGFESHRLGVRAGHYLSIWRDHLDARDLAQRMRERDVYVSARGSSVRVTPHLYNTKADLSRFLDALRSAAS